MLLETGRLALRGFTGSDVDLVVWLLGEPRVMRYIEDGKPVSRAEVERVVLPRLLGGPGWWAAHEKASGAFIGWFELSPAGGGVAELGYRLHPDFWGRGYATEGASALVAHGAAVGLTRIVGYTMAVNTGSRRVMEKVGLKYVRTFHEEWPDYIEGAEHGDVEYALDLGHRAPVANAQPAARGGTIGSMAELLTDDQVTAALTSLPSWQAQDAALVRSVELESFAQALQVVNRVAEIAENDNHHPDIDIRWRTLTFRCSTHSSGGITSLDVSLAEEIDGVIDAFR